MIEESYPALADEEEWVDEELAHWWDAASQSFLCGAKGPPKCTAPRNHPKCQICLALLAANLAS